MRLLSEVGGRWWTWLAAAVAGAALTVCALRAAMHRATDPGGLSTARSTTPVASAKEAGSVGEPVDGATMAAARTSPGEGATTASATSVGVDARRPSGAAARGAFHPRRERVRLDQLEDPATLALGPELERFARVRLKALPSAEDRATLARLARDPGLVADAARRVTAFDATEQQALARRRRMVLVDFLVAALAEADRGGDRGDSRRAVIEAVQGAIVADAWPTGEPLEVRKALAGDRIELAAALAKHAPEAFAELLERTSEGRGARFLAYAKAQQEGRP
jgi:hypothetical protein